MRSNQKGVAILFVLTAITLLTIVLVDFSFESYINKLRAYNSQDQLQARLNAEAGLKFALLRLEIYQKARNLMEKNKNLKKRIGIKDLNEIWSVPFIYPFPIGNETKLEMRASIEKFMENSLLEGEILTEIQNVSHLININLLRMAKPKIKSFPRQTSNSNSDSDESSGQKISSDKIILNLERRLVDLFRQKFDQRLQEDDDFFRKYSDIEPEMLIKEIKFYVSDVDKDFEPEIDNIRSEYASGDFFAKHAPLESISELYLLKSWDDELVNMIKDEITVHGVVAIDLNKITEQGLKLLIPEISDTEIKDFFEYRDDPDIPQYFNTVDEFKSYIIGTAKILSPSELNARFKEFEEAGIEFGVYSSLFKIISSGRYGRSEFTIDAFVEIPMAPALEKTQNPNQPNQKENREEGRDNSDRNSRDRKKTKPLLQFLPPRIVELIIY
ncbi:MAG: type II secretion system protein GspK [Bacteriovoracales bacterium]|nr:type II secretion system protein GspK [Bacteriovoracales bacterium]